MIGKVLAGRYEIIDRIGSGGMAVVYKAKCRLLNRFVAIKVLRDELKDDVQFVEKFKAEARAAASLTHPNIVSVFDVGEENGIYYFVMEYIEGITLKDIIDEKGALDWNVAAEFAIGIAGAIECAHKNNIVHRDIKPHNIMINTEGNVKVTDFGIARAVTSSTIVRGGNVIGSVHYFSPEQAHGGTVDFKSDIYSIGVVLYEMLTGRVPFDGDTPFNIAKKHIDTMAIPPRAVNPSVPQIMNDITMRAMAKEPLERYQKVSDMLQDLRIAIAGGNMATPAPTPAPAPEVVGGDETQFIPVVPPTQLKTQSVPPTAPVADQSQQPMQQPAQEEKKKDKKPIVWAWITGVVILGFAIFGALYVLNPGLFAGAAPITDVPNLVGLKYEDAVTKYKGQLEIIKKDSQNSDKYETGMIMAQDPKEKSAIPTDKKINVVVSLGKKDIVLENYAGKDYKQAQAALEAMGLSVETKFETNDTAPKDTVYKTSPAEKSQMSTGDKVTLYISTGPDIKKTQIPNLYGLSERDAKDALHNANLNWNVVYAPSSAPMEGCVTAQTIEAKREVDEGTEVGITVGTGPEATEAPTAQPTDPPTAPPTDPPTAQPTDPPTEHPTDPPIDTGGEEA